MLNRLHYLYYATLLLLALPCELKPIFTTNTPERLECHNTSTGEKKKRIFFTKGGKSKIHSKVMQHFLKHNRNNILDLSVSHLITNKGLNNERYFTSYISISIY